MIEGGDLRKDPDRLLTLGVNLVLAVMASASTEKIRPQDWWTRAASAFRVGLEGAEVFHHVPSLMAPKLQIEELRKDSVSLISLIGSDLTHPDDFEAWREECLTSLPMVVGLAKLERARQREEDKR